MNDGFIEISAAEVARKLQAGEAFTILDVRETWELDLAKITDKRVLNLPMSVIGRSYKDAFPPELQAADAEIVVMCHHGVRSENVTRWMLQQGWKNVSSLQGGIDAYASEVDPGVGAY